MGAKQVPKSIGGGKMNGMTFLGEDDFIEAMNSDNKKWRDEKVRQGTLKTKDGINLNYYYAKNDEAKGVVIFVHGFCEFWGKYHEYAWYVYRAGYSFYFLEQRGFGLSEGKTDDPDIVYIDQRIKKRSLSPIPWAVRFQPSFWESMRVISIRRYSVHRC